MSDKIEHLNMIQSVITRMANNSLQIKCWCIAIVSAVIVLSDSTIIWIGLLPVALFCFLDCYYLWQEQRFRKLYNEVRSKDESMVDFSMNTPETPKSKAVLSLSTAPFYAIIAIVLILIASINQWI